MFGHLYYHYAQVFFISSLIRFWVFTMFFCPQNISLSSQSPTYWVNKHFFPGSWDIFIVPSLHSELIRLVEWLVWALEWERLETMFLSLQLSLPSLMVGPCLFVSFAGVYGICLMLGSLSANDFICVSVLHVLWHEASALGCASSWMGYILD